MLDNQYLILRLLTLLTDDPILIYSNYFNNYILVIYYSHLISITKPIQFTRLIELSAIRQVYTGSCVYIFYNFKWPNYVTKLL